MAAPPVTTRVLPTGYRLQDGQYSHVAFSENPAIQFWEKSVKPPGIDNGEPVPQTTLFNQTWRTFAPKVLRTLTESNGKAAYDPGVVVAIVASCGFPTGCTIHWPTNATFSFWGFLQKADFDALEEGKQPELNYTVGITNWDYVNFVESGPLFVAAPGTP